MARSRYNGVNPRARGEGRLGMKASMSVLACGVALLAAVSAGCTQQQTQKEMMTLFPDETAQWLKAHPEYKPTSPPLQPTKEVASRPTAVQVHSVDVGFGAVGRMPVQWIGPDGPIDNSAPVYTEDETTYYGR